MTAPVFLPTFSFAAVRGFGALRCGGASLVQRRSRVGGGGVGGGGVAEVTKRYGVEEVLA